jgi:hypothetical protein
VQDVAHVVDIQRHKKRDEHKQQDPQRMDYAPHHRVRPHQQAVAELQRAVAHEREGAQQRTRAQALVDGLARVRHSKVDDDHHHNAQAQQRARRVQELKRALLFHEPGGDAVLETLTKWPWAPQEVAIHRRDRRRHPGPARRRGRHGLRPGGGLVVWSNDGRQMRLGSGLKTLAYS